MDETIRNELFEKREEKYKAFILKLTPTLKEEEVIGVRMPALRQMAKKTAKQPDALTLVAEPRYYEERMIEAITVGYLKKNLAEKKDAVHGIVKKLDNWAICDSFCSTLKMKPEEKEAYFDFIKNYFLSGKEYESRFAAVMSLNYFAEQPYMDRVLAHFEEINHQGYYVKMALAWAISVFYTKDPKKIENYLNKQTLDRFTHNKAIQKITESNRVTKEEKDHMRELKRK